MEWTLRELRFLAEVVDAGTFTDAAARLHGSQAAVSRTIAGLERALGERLVRRLPRGVELTGAGQRLLPQARRVLAEADRFTEFVATRHSTLRLGYAWAALGSHTAKLQRGWSREDIDLELVRVNTPSSGLVEGLTDVAVTRVAVDERRFDSVVVGLERRLVAFASDDAQWSRRRQVTMGEIAERTVVIDPRVGTTGPLLWPGREPRFIETYEVDSWLDVIAAGRGVGTTAEATAHHHPRPGVAYRPIKDASRIPVRLAWWRGDPPPGLRDLVQAVTALYAS